MRWSVATGGVGPVACIDGVQPHLNPEQSYGDAMASAWPLPRGGVVLGTMGPIQEKGDVTTSCRV